MKTTVYVETSVISYLTGRISRDLIVAAHQQITREWWETASNRYDLFISPAVLDEIQAGDPQAVERRLTAIKDIGLLGQTPEVATLANNYSGSLGLPPSASTDALHIAFAVAWELDCLVTWNCTHIAAQHILHRLREVNDSLGKYTPDIVTPESLLEV
jgi:hypothetical protein